MCIGIFIVNLKRDRTSVVFNLSENCFKNYSRSRTSNIIVPRLQLTPSDRYWPKNYIDINANCLIIKKIRLKVQKKNLISFFPRQPPKQDRRIDEEFLFHS